MYQIIEFKYNRFNRVVSSGYETEEEANEDIKKIKEIMDHPLMKKLLPDEVSYEVSRVYE